PGPSRPCAGRADEPVARHRRHHRPRGGRPGHPPAPQAGGRSQEPALSPDRAGRGIHAGAGLTTMRLLPASLWPRFLKRRLPTSLWGRSLLIIVLPVLIMQAAVTWVFFDAHWQTVTARLSEGLAGDVAWAVESYADQPTAQHLAVIADRAERSMSLSIALQEEAELPREQQRGPIGVVDRAMERALAARLDAPFWFSTTRYPAYVDIRVQQPQGVLRIIAPRERAVA